MNWTIFHQQVFPIRHKLYRFALRITGSVHEAEDVVQEVLERVWKTSAEQSQNIRNWEAWCMTLTRNRSLDKTRDMARQRTAPIEQELDFQTDGGDTARTMEVQDLASLVQRLMKALPEKQRLVMHLRDIEELSYDEIAEVLDISMDQVKVNLHRARKTIRTQMLRVFASETTTTQTH
jgi:RNA polymerase sigma-70 factor (ECF subfamily)